MLTILLSIFESVLLGDADSQFYFLVILFSCINMQVTYKLNEKYTFPFNYFSIVIVCISTEWRVVCLFVLIFLFYFYLIDFVFSEVSSPGNVYLKYTSSKAKNKEIKINWKISPPLLFQQCLNSCSLKNFIWFSGLERKTQAQGERWKGRKQTESSQLLVYLLNVDSGCTWTRAKSLS